VGEVLQPAAFTAIDRATRGAPSTSRPSAPSATTPRRTAMERAVAGWSPVIITGMMPADRGPRKVRSRQTRRGGASGPRCVARRPRHPPWSRPSTPHGRGRPLRPRASWSLRRWKTHRGLFGTENEKLSPKLSTVGGQFNVSVRNSKGEKMRGGGLEPPRVLPH
jgi:hypothetical protein